MGSLDENICVHNYVIRNIDFVIHISTILCIYKCILFQCWKTLHFMKNINPNFQNELGSRSNSTHIGNNNF